MRESEKMAAGGIQAFCGGTFWNETLLWDNTWPQFTECFIHTALVWIPVAFLWLLLPYYVTSVRTYSTNVVFHHTALNMARTMCCLSLALLSLAQLFRRFSMTENTTWAACLGDVLLLASYLLMVVMTQYERKKGAQLSGVPFFFWLLQATCSVIPFYTFIIEQKYKSDVGSFVLLVLAFVLQLASLILTGFVDHGRVTSKYTSLEQTTCPVNTCSFPSYLVFWWMTKLVVTGCKKELEQSDLWPLPAQDTCSTLLPQFEQLSQREQRRCSIVNRKQQEAEMKDAAMSNSVELSNCGVHEVNGHGTFTEKSGLLHNGPGQKSQSSSLAKDRQQLTKPSLSRVLFRMFGKEFFVCYLMKISSDLMILATPLLLGSLIGYLETRPAGREWQGFVLSAAMFGCLMIRSLLWCHSFFGSSRIGMKIKSVLTAAVYKKAFVLSNTVKSSVTIGEVVNLMSVDAQRIQDSMGFVFLMLTTPVLIIAACVVLYTVIGPPILAGAFVMLCLIPMTVCVVTKLGLLQRENLNFKDRRIKLYNEILSGIKVLKLHAWEPSFRQRIRAVRLKEVAILFKLGFFKTLMNVVWSMAGFLTTLATFATYVLLDRSNYLDTAKAFTLLSVFSVLRGPLYGLTNVFHALTQALVSVKRINRFLNEDELDPNAVVRDGCLDPVISMKNASFTWDRNQRPALADIDLTVGEGLLVAVVGPVGCGKSSLLSAMLGEMDKVQGEVTTRGRFAYVPQQAWIQNATVRDNILFGRPYNRSQYKQTVTACQLTHDFAIMPAGDMTEIGENGINLSGGQKQRVSVARAVYSDSDVYLLDDPLSAVDSHVGKAIFRQVIADTGILKGKTRVLVTHGVHWLPMVDDIIVMEDGKVSERGSYEELILHDGPFAQFLKTYLTVDNTDEEEDQEIAQIRNRIREEVESVTSDYGSSADEAGKERRARKKKKKPATKGGMQKIEEPEGCVSESEDEREQKRSHGTLITEEVIQKGQVKNSVLKDYCRAAGAGHITLAFVSFLAAQSVGVGYNFWLKVWSGDPKMLNASTSDLDALAAGNVFYLGTYGTMGIGQLLFLTVFYYLFWTRVVTAARVLHSRLADRLLRAPMAFFDTTPIGRILNRVSHDVEVVDDILPIVMHDNVAILSMTMVTLLVIIVQIPESIVVLLPVVVLYILCQRFYVPTMRQLGRFESVTRSPIFALFRETLTGAPSIRAYGAKDRFLEETMLLVDRNIAYSFASQALVRWLNIILDFLTAVVITTVALFAVLKTDRDSGGTIGLSVSYVLQVCGSITWLTRQICSFQSNIVSVERLKEYSELDTEAEWILPDKRPPAAWPQRGEIIFNNYQTRYREGLDLVLKGVCCSIRDGEKVGIVGRTGAGKSSLVLSLFRLIESTGGAIFIDGVNIADMGLHDLRSRLTILPQDPVIFSGSLRTNLDPFDKYSNDELWQALEKAHLKSAVTQLPDKLQFQCGEEGSNLSVGQRQLVCLARTLLRKTQILVLDEATAAVDMETDALIQEVIRVEFSTCTVITIAHRLNTIMDYDRVMVLDEGVVREFAPPEALLADVTSLFYGMAKDAGLV